MKLRRFRAPSMMDFFNQFGHLPQSFTVSWVYKLWQKGKNRPSNTFKVQIDPRTMEWREMAHLLNPMDYTNKKENHPKFMPRMDSCQFIIVAVAKNCSTVGLLLLQLGISAQAKIQVSKQKWQPSHGIPENPQI